MKTELVWEGKYDEYGDRRQVDIAGCAMPMQKIETIDEPRSQAAAKGEQNLLAFEKETTRLDDFRNMLIWGDNKLVTASLLRQFKGKIDLIYIDPPFDVGADFTMSVPIGEEKEKTTKDQSTLEMVAYRDMWGKGTDSYLHMMYERLAIMHEFLSPNGCMYVHCDWRVNYFLRTILNDIFGREKLVNEIIWHYRTFQGQAHRYFARKHDTLLFFRKGQVIPGGANEIVTVVDHPAFANLYQQELSQEGLPIEIVEVDKVPRTTVSIYPDERNKDVNALEILVPRLSAGHRIVPKLEGVTLDEVKSVFEGLRLKPLPLAGKTDTTVQYEGRQLFTGEIVEKMTFHIELLQSGMGAVSYYIKQLEMICKVRAIHTPIAPLMQTFLEEILFEKKASLFENELIARLGDSDVGEYVRAVFVPLIRKHTTTVEKRAPEQEPIALSMWRPYQVTHSERRPVLPAQKTLFNLVPCNRDLEVAMTEFLTGRAMDVAAFAKNAGPQCLRIDYIGSGGRLAFYTPDFFVRVNSGHCYVIETKGREDIDVHKKARAAIEWCKSASRKKCKWEYIYVSQEVFERLSDDSVEALSRTCAPSLQRLLAAEEEKVQMPLFASIIEREEAEEEKLETEGIVDKVILETLPDRYRKAAEQAIAVFRFLEKKTDINYGQVFQALLGSIDEACRGLLLKRLLPLMPEMREEQRVWFDPYIDNLGRAKSVYYLAMAKNLRKTLVYRNGFSPLGLLRTCLDYALNDSTRIDGVFEAIKEGFKTKGALDLLTVVANINDFRNTYVAHQEKELTDVNLARDQLGKWIAGLKYVSSQP
jgi:type III restriction enzyme